MPRLKLRLFLATTALVAACADVTAPPRIFVSRVPSGMHASREDGDVLKLVRWELDPRAGLTRGYWVVKSEHQWRDLWPSLDPDRIPLLPQGIDFANEMLLVAAPTDVAATGARIHQVVDTQEAGIHIYLTQALPGLGCPSTPDGKVAVDLVRVRTFDKEMHFHVSTKNDDPCSAPSEAKVECRVDGTNDAYQEHLAVEPGKTVSCIAGGKLGSRATVDRTWSFRTLPAGTTTKMTIAEGEGSIRFPTDAFGTYSVGLDVTDDLGRTTAGTNDVQVNPAKDALAIQMLWTKFQPDDDPSTFPRVELHLVGEKAPTPLASGRLAPLAARSQPWILVKGDCTLENDKPPPWCRARVLGTTSVEEVSTDAFPLYRIGVHYSDDRYAGQPILCVRTFRGGRASEWCDDKVRSEGNWWDIGHVDAITGKVPVPPAPPPPKPSASPASSGTPASSAAPASSATPPPSGSAAPRPAGSAPVKGAPPPPAPSSAPSTKPAATPTPKPKGSADPWTP